MGAIASRFTRTGSLAGFADMANQRVVQPKELIVGFWYPENTYARGMQRDQTEVHRFTERSSGLLSTL